MKIDDLINDPTEATMGATPTPLRYEFAPTAAFATTRAGAERRSRDAAAATTPDSEGRVPAQHLLRRLATLLTGSVS